jgi:hypothetical protein
MDTKIASSGICTVKNPLSPEQIPMTCRLYDDKGGILHVDGTKNHEAFDLLNVRRFDVSNQEINRDVAGLEASCTMSGYT